MKKFLRNLPRPLLLIIVTVALIALMMLTRSAPPTTKASNTRWPVEAFEIHPAPVAPQYTLYGTVESPRHATLRSSINTHVTGTPKLEGNQVSQGDVLITLDPTEAKLVWSQKNANVKNLQAQLDKKRTAYDTHETVLKHEQALLKIIERQLARETTLAQRQVSSQASQDDALRALEQQKLSIEQRLLDLKNHPHEIAQLSAQLEKAQAELKDAALDLKRTQIEAPFNGRVEQLHVVPGERVAIHDPLINLYDTSALEIRAQVPDTLVTQIKAADEVSAHVFHNNEKVSLYFNRFGGAVHPGQAGVDAIFSPKAPDAFFLGEALTLTLQIPHNEVLYAVPMTAIYHGTHVYRIHNGLLEDSAITRIGSWQDTDGTRYALVQSKDLKPGDIVLKTHLPSASHHLPVAVTRRLRLSVGASTP